MYRMLQNETIAKLLQLNHQPLKLYLALCQYVTKSGVCWVRYIDLQRATKMSSGRCMRNSITALEEFGLIKSWRDGNRRYYFLLDEKLRASSELIFEKPSFAPAVHWLHIRKEALNRDGWRCTNCGSGEKLHVHHLTYENVGHEKLEDLITVCASCHPR